MHRSKLKEVARLKQARTPERRSHFFWVDPGVTLREKAEALIASGRASPNDQFVEFRWKSDEEK